MPLCVVYVCISRTSLGSIVTEVGTEYHFSILLQDNNDNLCMAMMISLGEFRLTGCQSI